MSETAYLEESRKDASELAQILNRVPENKKECVLMLVTGYALGLGSEERTTEAGWRR